MIQAQRNTNGCDFVSRDYPFWPKWELWGKRVPHKRESAKRKPFHQSSTAGGTAHIRIGGYMMAVGGAGSFGSPALARGQRTISTASSTSTTRPMAVGV